MSDYTVSNISTSLPKGAPAGANIQKCEKISSIDKKLLNESKTIYIYNIYNRDWDKYMGIFGNHFIKGVETHGSSNREQWEKYRLSREEKSILISYDTSKGGEGYYDYKTYEGVEFVEDLLRSKDKGADSLENWGVFYSFNNPPTQEELDKAQEKLILTLHDVVTEGDKLWSGPEQKKNTIGAHHRAAAEYLKITRDWIRGTRETMKDCPWCGKNIKQHSALCDGCGRIVDNNLYTKLMSQFGGEKEETPKVGRPKNS